MQSLERDHALRRKGLHALAAQQFDVTGNVYTVTSRGRASSTGSQVDIEVVVDRSELPARIVSYRER